MRRLTTIRIINASFVAGFILFGAVYAQQSNLPPCRVDYGIWTNCFGTYTFPDGGKYVGDWKNGMYDGQGSLSSWSNDMYVGKWKSGRYDGQGTFTFANGDRYVGEWKDGKHNGQGIEYRADGSVLKSGLYENGVLVRSAPAGVSPVTAALPVPAQHTPSPVQTSAAPFAPTTVTNRLSLEASKVKCSELGFKPATERFGTCVLQLSK